MKKLFYIFLAVLLVNCADLDLEPHQSLSPDVAYATFDDCNNAARGIYMRAVDVYGDDYILLADAFCDNLISFAKGRQSYSMFNAWTINSGSSFMWLRPYAAIINCNLLIENMQIPEGEEGNKFKPLKAEALAMRAIMHFELVKQHGKAYVLASDSDLGVPYVKVTNSDNKPARDNVKSNFENIVADLTEAYGLMEFEENPDNSRITKEAVAGFLAKVYLYMADYVNADKYAKLALSNSKDICAIENFSKVWTDETEEGVLFKLVVTQKDDLKVGDWFNQYLSGAYKSEFVAPQSFATLYDQANDVRFSSYFEKSAFQGDVAYHVIKYVGLADETHIRNQVSLKVLRAAEMKLIIAESAVRKTPVDEVEANKQLKELKEARIVGYTHLDLTGQALIDEIMVQRRLELAVEWDRYTTIKRLGQNIQRLEGEGDLADGTGRPWAETLLKSDDHRFLFPILTSELDANPNMEQNPGY